MGGAEPYRWEEKTWVVAVSTIANVGIRAEVEFISCKQKTWASEIDINFTFRIDSCCLQTSTLTRLSLTPH